MRSFNKNDRSGDRRGGGSFGRRDSRGGSGRLEMHRATCAQCGASCEVPFKPTGDKPVYCSNCFRGKEDSAPRRSSGGRDFGRSSSRDREMFKAVCAQCGANCEIPFKPTTDRPILCSDCFGGNNSRGSDRKVSGGNNQLEAQLKSINEKLDKLLQSLAPKALIEKKKVTVKPEIKKKAVVTKKAKIKKVKKSLK